MRKAAALALSVVGTACFKPTVADGSVQCGASGLCPPGFQCAANGLCYLEGTGPGADGNSAGDAAGGDDARGDQNVRGDDRGDTTITGDTLTADTALGDVNTGDTRGADTFTGDDFILPVLTVGPTYVASPSWNDYVRHESPGLATHRQPGTPCDGTESTGWRDCIHAGEQRRVDTTQLTSCAGLTLTDNLGTFDWFCEDNAGAGPVTFFTTALAAGKGLGHLVDTTMFLNNSVTLFRNANPLASSPPAVWGWMNPVVAAPDNSAAPSAVLDVAGTIYVIDGMATSNGYNLNADRVALVIRPGGALRIGNNLVNNITSAAEPGSGNTALIAAGDQKFLWVEGPYGGAPSPNHAIFWFDVIFSRLHNVTVVQGNSVGLRLVDSRFNRLRNIVAYDNDNEGVFFNTADVNTIDGSDHNEIWGLTAAFNRRKALRLRFSSHNELRHVRIADAVAHGIEMDAARNNLLVDVTIYNVRHDGMATNDGEAIDMDFYDNGSFVTRSEGNIFSDVIIAAAAADGFRGRNNAYNMTVSHLTTFNNFDIGFAPNEAGELTAANILALHNNNHGFHLVSPAWEGAFAEVYSANNRLIGVRLNNSDTMRTFRDFQFLGHLWVGQNSDNCVVGSVAISNPGLIDNTCTSNGMEGSTTPISWLAPEPGATFHPGRNLAGSIVAKVTTGDSQNPHDTNGTADYDTITDWTSFESPYRVWGREGGTFPNFNNAGACLPGATCRIWDLRVLTSDSELHNVNGAFTPGVTCPASAHGDRVITDRSNWDYAPHFNAIEGDTGDGDGTCEAGETCANRFLVNAKELLDDGVGDDDGLCESDESCTYSPHIGAYQGEGPLTAPCTFQDGTVTNVDLRAYSVTGQ